MQGVGFRPFVFRLAGVLGLGGYVLNDARGVLLEIEGDDDAVERFLDRLSTEAPPLATVERVLREEIAVAGERDFAIVRSAGGAPAALVSPDSATCAECLRELFDPSDRRFRYPFINCTNCGPRFTIVRGVPYDRLLTTMAGFVMCARCRSEYDDHDDRRFHAQPNGCPDCGPRASLTDAAGTPAGPSARDAVEAAAVAINRGAVVAVKGVGGFHLACRADDEEAVSVLRSRKHREEKPFALMVRDLESARALAELSPEEAVLLVSRVRPIVLSRRLRDAPVASGVAPRSRTLGLMLPYSPLHHLLAADAGAALVMTSGNVSDEPIAYRDADAIERLAGVADLFLMHDRPIHTRTDDSVVRVAGRPARPVVLRRSRGYVPGSIALPVDSRPLLACGAELKSTFCVARERRAWVGHHIGDLKNYETLESFREGIAHFERLFSVTPEVVAHDLHPDYLSTAYALERDGVRTVGVQHHHAHLAACLAEHGEHGPAVGAIFDGSGYGTDGTVWGGELLFGGLGGFERAGHLRPVPLPGGDRAVREPWRMACAWLGEALGHEPGLPPSLGGSVDQAQWMAVARLSRAGTLSPGTTSAGRLFDAVAALCGLSPRATYEGQAAMELEALALGDGSGYHPFGLESGTLDPRETILALARDLAAGTPVSVVAARFHAALADATVRACSEIAEQYGVDLIVLSGGVFQNARLLEQTMEGLARTRLRVLTPVLLPPNDGGISYGQAAVAAASTSTG